MYIRSMTIQDIPFVAQIESKCFSEPWNENMLLAEINNPNATFFVCEQNDTIIGYGGYIFTLDEGDIMDVAILPDYRGRGYGKLLMNSLLDDMKNKKLKYANLECRKNNIVARKLYETIGFEFLGYRPNYYFDDDAAIYKKEL